MSARLSKAAKLLVVSVLRISVLCQALTRWGGALLELAHFQQGEEARRMIREVSPAVLP